MNQHLDDKIIIIETKRAEKSYTFSNYHFTETDTLTSIDMHKKTLSFNNTIGYSPSIPNEIQKRALSKDKYLNPFINTNFVFIPKLTNITLKNNNSMKNHNPTNEKESLTKTEINDNDNINMKAKNNITIQFPLKINKIQMRPTNVFENFQKSSLKYKIKKEDIPRLKPIPQQPKGTIININHNVNHNIQINVNNTSGKLSLNPIRFKNIKIKEQNTIQMNNENANISFGNNASNTIQGNPKGILMPIASDESIPISLQNSFLTKKSNDSIKNTKISNTVLSNISSLKEQDTLLSYNLSEDEFDDCQPCMQQKKSLFEDKNKNQNKTINKEAFNLFCLDFDKKLSSIKSEIKKKS